MKNKFLTYVSIFLASFVLFFLVAPLRGGYIRFLGLSSFPMSMLAYAILYFCLTALILHKRGQSLKPWVVVLLLIAGTSVMDIYMRFIRPGGFERTLVSLPDFAIRMLAILSGWGYHCLRGRAGKITLASVFLLFALWSSYFGYRQWLNFLNFGSASGKIELALDTPPVFLDGNGDTVALSRFQGQYVVLDFWNSTCGYCIQQFPIFQQFCDDLEDQDKAVVFSVHCRLDKQGETYATGESILREKGYSFPALSAGIVDPMLKTLGVKAFPTVLIFDPAGKLIFRGRLEDARSYLELLIAKNE